jgi:hypothetical protein
MAKTTIFIDEYNELLIKKEQEKTNLSKKDIVNNAILNQYNDLTNKELLEELKRIIKEL